MADAERLGLEVGADVAKVKYPGNPESMERACRMAGPTKVVMSGGSKTSDREFLETVEAAIEGGAEGLAVGRNVWQREDPEGMLDALGALIHDDASVDEALEHT
jgi:class I fructose-bisphosphate aldolase